MKDDSGNMSVKEKSLNLKNIKTVEIALNYIPVGIWYGKRIFAYRKTETNFTSSRKKWSNISEGFCMQSDISYFKNNGNLPRWKAYDDGMGYGFVFLGKNMRAHKRPYTSIMRGFNGKIYFTNSVVDYNRKLKNNQLQKVKNI